MRYPGFVGSSYKARSVNFDAQRCLNLYLEKSDPGVSAGPAMLVGTPGCRPILDLDGQCVRGMIKFNQTTGFVVVGPNVYRINEKLALVTLVGNVPNARTPVSMASNGIVVFFVTGPQGFVINPATNTLTEYIDPSFSGGVRVDFIDGSFIFNQPGTAKFWVTEPYSMVLNGLSFGVAEGSPDNLVSLLVDHREVWLFGVDTTEVWYDTGDTTNFQYSRIDGAFMEQGCVAPFSVAKMDNTVIWLSQNENGAGMVVRATGYTALRISNHAIEAEFQTYSDITDAIAYTYQDEGHIFYMLTFPTADKTWCFDASTNLWHERGYRNANGSMGRHRSNCHMYLGNTHVVGDWESGRLYDLDLDYYSDAGNPLIRLRACPYFLQPGARFPWFSLEILMQTGVGLNVGQGSNPIGMLRWSDDGGHVWENMITEDIGMIGQHDARVIFRRLGQSNDSSCRAYEFSISDPVKVAIIGAEINGG